MLITKVFLWLATYSFIGWIYEFVVTSIQQRRVVNPGFLNGPLCPIYGFGALFCILLLYQKPYNIGVLFLLGMLLACTVEYLTALLLEKLFDARWWDYSHLRFNFQGRVSLLGAVVFGMLSILLIKFIHPFISGLIDQVPTSALIASASFLFLAITLDLFVTVRHLLLLKGRLTEIQAALNHFFEHSRKMPGELKDALLEKFEESEYYSERIKKLLHNNRFQNLRLALAFPKLRSLKNNDAWQKLKHKLLNSD